MSKRLTLKQINMHLEAQGIAERLYKGKGYFYFSDGETHRWYATMICRSNLIGMTLQDVINERTNLSQMRM